MKITNLLVLFLIATFASGCTPFNRSLSLDKTLMQHPVLPMPIKDDIAKFPAVFPPLQTLNLEKGEMIRQIADPKEGTNYTVRIVYQDKADLKNFDPITGVENAISDVLNHDLPNQVPLLGEVWKWIASPFSKIGQITLSKDDAHQLMDLIVKLRSFQDANFQTVLNTNIQELLDDQLQTFAVTKSASLTIHVSLQGLLAAYLKAYLDGNFVDRWGVALSQPDLTKLGSDSVEPVTKVALEAILDYHLMTPIVHDPAASDTNKTPTFAVIFPQLYEDISDNPDAPGITAPENEAIKYTSGLSGEAAKHLSSLVVKTLGGASFGAKISTGDNSTLAQIISAVCEELLRRNTEEFSYDIFERFQYQTNGAGYDPDFAANTNNLFRFDSDPNVDLLVQKGVVALLVSQDSLKNLLNGGWKLSPSNITNYEALASSLNASFNAGDPVATNIMAQLSSTAQAVVNAKSSRSADQQLLLDNLNQLIQASDLTSTNLVATTAAGQNQGQPTAASARQNMLKLLGYLNSNLKTGSQ